MKMMNVIRPVLGLAGVVVLGACAGMNPPSGNPQYGSANPYGTVQQSGTSQAAVYPYSGYGVVHSIELVQRDNGGIGGTGIGIGTIAGAVVGGVVGNQVGSGRGNTIATVAGAAGGAYLGHQLENSQQQQDAAAYRITVRMQDGAYQTLVQNTDVNFRVGDRVRIGDGIAYRY